VRTDGLEEAGVGVVELGVGRQGVLGKDLEEGKQLRLRRGQLLDGGQAQKAVQLHHLRKADGLHRGLHGQSGGVLSRGLLRHRQVPHQTLVGLHPAHASQQ